jgi:hypothetical protein
VRSGFREPYSGPINYSLSIYHQLREQVSQIGMVALERCGVPEVRTPLTSSIASIMHNAPKAIGGDAIFIPSNQRIAECAQHAVRANKSFASLTEADKAALRQAAVAISNQTSEEADKLRRSLRSNSTHDEVAHAVNRYNELRGIIRTQMNGIEWRTSGRTKLEEAFFENPIAVYARLRSAVLEGDMLWLNKCTGPFFSSAGRKSSIAGGAPKFITLHPVNIVAPSKDELRNCVQGVLENRHPGLRLLPTDKASLLAAAGTVSDELSKAADGFTVEFGAAARRGDLDAAGRALRKYSERTDSALKILSTTNWVGLDEVSAGKPER